MSTAGLLTSPSIRAQGFFGGLGITIYGYNGYLGAGGAAVGKAGAGEGLSFSAGIIKISTARVVVIKAIKTAINNVKYVRSSTFSQMDSQQLKVLLITAYQVYG